VAGPSRSSVRLGLSKLAMSLVKEDKAALGEVVRQDVFHSFRKLRQQPSPVLDGKDKEASAAHLDALACDHPEENQSASRQAFRQAEGDVREHHVGLFGFQQITKPPQSLAPRRKK